MLLELYFLSYVITFSDTGDQVIVVKGQILTNYSEWGHFYRVEFDITVNVIPENWLNVFHFTKSNNNIKDYGDRAPAFWIRKDGYFYVASAVSGDKNHWFDFQFELGKKYHVLIRQFEDHDEKVIYEIEIDNEVKHSVPNNQALDFTNVILYVSDPWHDPFSSDYGILENLNLWQSGVYY